MRLILRTPLLVVQYCVPAFLCTTFKITNYECPARECLQSCENHCHKTNAVIVT